MYDYGFAHFEAVTVAERAYALSVISGKSKTVTVTCEARTIALPKTRGDVAVTLELVRFVYAPIVKGDIVGRAVVTLSGKTVAVIPLVASETVELDKRMSFPERLFS